MADKSDRLLKLAEAAFPDITPSEREVIEAAARGEAANFQSKEKEENDPARSETWPEERKVRAEVLRWLCVEPDARRLVDPKGVQVCGARIEGPLDLAFAVVPFPLGLMACAIPQKIFLLGARIASVNLNGSHTGPIWADGLVARGDLLFRNGFYARGEVRLMGARVRGNLVCIGGVFENKGKNALNADRIKVGGAMLLREGFRAKGEVRLLGAKVRGSLACAGGVFENPGKKALSADGIEVGGNVFLAKGFRAQGEVRLLGARIHGNLECDGGVFENKGKDALSADGIEVDGDVILQEGFHAQGEVRLLGARIRGDLSCTGGVFENKGKNALSADGIEVGGNVFLQEGFRAQGEVRLPRARIRGDLDCVGGAFENPGKDALNADGMDVSGALFMREGFKATGKVSLVHAKARVLADDKTSWPAHGDLDLEGFLYEGLVGPTDSKSRLVWLACQYPAQRRQGHFRPQPYEQLAAVLRKSGHVAESKKVLIAKERDLRKYSDLGRLARAGNWFLGVTIGYGYRVRRALGFALVIVLAGFLFFWLGERAGLLSPTFSPPSQANASRPKRLDEAFCPFVYSLDTFLPIVNLYQEGRWLPNRGGGDVVTTFCSDRYVGITWGFLLCIWFWIEIGAGWLLTTLALAGLTGLVRRD